MSDQFNKAYIEWCRFRVMKQYWPRIQVCVDQLSDDEFWWREHESNNSVANLLIHLTGNLNQFILSAIGGASDTRDREKEFSERRHSPKAEIMRNLSEALEKSDRVLSNFDPGRLLEPGKVQGRERPYFEIISAAVEHFALHVGQIIFITKLKTGKELKF